MIAKFSVKKPYTVLVAVIMVIILGVVSFTKMTTDLMPSINLPYAIVMTTYPGASPETVEMVVTKPVEAAMATVSNIENVSSVSSENYSMVILEFSQTTNMDSVSLEMRESLDQIKTYWDDSIGNPIIMKLNPDMMPIMVAAVGMEGLSNAEISEIATNRIIPDIESIEGVASASATGLLEEKVHVIIRQDKIDAINEQVFASIDGKMVDAEKDLADGRKELADGWAEITTSLNDLEEAKQKIVDGKQEIADSKSDLTSTKNELATKKQDSINKISEGYTKLIDGKSQIVSNKANLNMLLQQIGAELEAKGSSIDALLESEGTLLQSQTELTGIFNKYNWDAITQNELDELKTTPQIMALFGGTVPNLGTDAETKAAIKAAIQGALTQIETALKSIGEIEKLKATLATLTEKEGELDQALTEITKGQMEAAAGFGSGEAQIAFGEAQMEAAEKQLETSEEQLDSGKEQIDGAKDQLTEAEKQIKDGEEQLADAKEQAYNSADMNGVLTVETVKSLLTAQNFSMPGGYVTEEGIDYLVRVGDKPKDAKALADMPILNVQMEGVETITLSDVADVFMTDNSDEIYTNINGSQGVMVSVQKQTGYSTGDVSDKINAKFEKMMQEDETLSLLPLMDQGIYIDLVMDSIVNNVLFGAILAILILILFLRDLRPTFIIACSIPISLVTALVCMYFSGITLNVISLSGLALGIGMLVDNSIVVIENIYRLRNEGASMKEAAIQGAKEVSGAIVASTLTTVCVFAPIVFTEGITRQLFVDMGLTIAYSLFASLLIALTVVPAMSSKMLRKTKEVKESRFLEKVLTIYQKVLERALKLKAVVFLVVIVLLVGSIALALQNGTAFMADMDSNQLSMTITLPEGTPLSETGEVTDTIIERIATLPDIENIGAMVSSGAGLMMGGGGETTNQTSLYMTTIPEKSKTNEAIGEDIKKLLADIKNVEIEIVTASMDMSALGGSGITVQVRGREIDTLQEVAVDIAGIIEDVEGTADVSDGMEKTTEELRVYIDRQKAIEEGLTVGQVFAQISPKLADPTAATALVTDIKDYDVYVMNEKDIKLTREEVKNLTIETKDADGNKKMIPLSDIASFEKKEGLSSINRNDQTRYIQVSASIAEGYNIGIVANQVNKEIEKYEMPDGYHLVFSGENETINDAMEQVGLMMLLAVAFMYLIMVAQFQSLLSPFIIMFTIPLAFTGGFFGLYASNSEVSVIAMIGFVMLAGIIVNNGIVLVDYVNQLCEQGMEKKEAILTAGRTRLRPVLMTALTTILALSTMVFSKDMGSEMAKPMAIVTIGGLIYGTLLTLIVIPCIYDVFHREKKEEKIEE